MQIVPLKKNAQVHTSNGPLRWITSTSLRLAIVGHSRCECECIIALIEEAGHECFFFSNLDTFTKWCRNTAHDIIILDQSHQSRDLCNSVFHWIHGSAVCEAPVVVIGNCLTENCITDAIESGASEFVVKPVNKMDLLARLRQLIHKPVNTNIIQAFSPFLFDTSIHQLFINEQPIELTLREFSLALYMFHNSGRVIRRKKILADIWGISNDIDTRRVDTYISRIRAKLKLNAESSWRINSIYQKGYIMEKLQPGK